MCIRDSTLPLKSQFKDGESFYGTKLHEMGHSTCVKNRLNRKGFYENDKFNYGREELVAELISALSGEMCIRDSQLYLQSM